MKQEASLKIMDSTWNVNKSSVIHQLGNILLICSITCRSLVLLRMRCFAFMVDYHQE